MKKSTISRRHFLTLSGGLTFVVTAGAIFPKFLTEEEKQFQATSDNRISAWVHLSEEGRITFFNPASEMGQGSMTALAVILAEEMDVDWSDVHIEYSPIDPDTYGRSWGRSRRPGGTMLTVGSATVRGYYFALRHAGAQARYVLLKNVADKWNVPIGELSTEPGVVIHKASGKKISYGEIAAFAKAPGTLPDIPEDQLKRPEQFRLIGNNKIARFDIPAKVNGSAQYAIDVQLPGMVYGVISRTPVNGAKPTLLNEQALKAMPGVIEVVMLSHGVGLVAETIEQALAAKKQIQIQWSDDAKAASHTSETAFDEYPAIAEDPGHKANSITDTGNADEAFKQVVKTYSSDYKNDYAYHAQMEPLNAVVRLAEDGKSAEVWVGTQGPEGAKAAVASTLGLEQSQVTLHPCYLGGGFGRRSMSGYVSEAAQLAKAVHRPVKLIWTREDDVQYGAFRPQSLQRMQAGVDKAGNITAWKHTIVGPGGGLLGSGAKNEFYTLPNQQISAKSVEHGIRTKHWRAVGHGPNKYAIEAFIDEIAWDLKQDPYAFRRHLMRDNPRALKVLDTVAEMANWGKNVPEGRARGISFAERSGSLTAAVAELSVDRKTGQINVHRIWAALDAGVVVQPDNAIAQVEGSVLMGLGNVLYESITFKNGVVQQSNYHDYQVLKMADIPESFEVTIIPSHEPPAGIGEAGLPNVGGMVANAFLALTGKKLLHMPFTPEKVLAVLGS